MNRNPQPGIRARTSNYCRLLVWLCCTGTVLATGASNAQVRFDVFEASIEEIQAALTLGVVNSQQLVQQYLARIERFDRDGPRLNSIIRINPAAAEQARLLDAERASSGPRGPLHGVPILVKDNYSTVDMPTSNASVALAGFVPNANATQIDRLLEAGAIVLAKTNLHEYARGITTISSLGGQTLNPYDLRRVPGGSSGGTGAAVAASFGAIGLGSDTCGSIRIPSAFNNLIGLRPTKGLGSIHGVIPLSHTQDVAGPLARSARDLAIVLDIVNGLDAQDPATEAISDAQRPRFVETLGTVPLRQLRLGKIMPMLEGAAPEVRRAINAALDWYDEQGADIMEVEFAELDELLEGSGVIGYEFKDDLNRYLGQFGSEQIAELADVLANGLVHESLLDSMRRSEQNDPDREAYGDALAKREELAAGVKVLLEEKELDALVYPTMDFLPVMIGDPQRGGHCSLSANSGLPALSMPVGFSDSGLPVGMELLGLPWQDARLLAIAEAYERGNKPRRPPWLTPSLQDEDTVPGSLRVSAADLGLTAELTLDRNRNQLVFNARTTSGSDLTAVTLHVARAGEELSDEPVAATLLQTHQAQAAGEIHLSPSLREGFLQGRLWLRVFGLGLPATGARLALTR